MIKGLHVVRKGRRGKPPIYYVYAYRGGPQIHRHEGPTKPKLSPEAIQRLLQAEAAKVERMSPKETLSDLIRQWRPGSPEWQALTANTKRTWSSALDMIEDKWGNTPLTVWSDPRMSAKVVAWRDSRAATPRGADIGVDVLRALLKFGRLRGKVTINIAEGIPHIYRSATRSDIVWTKDDFAAFQAAAAKMNLNHVNDGLRLASLTGLRREDLVTVSWDHLGENTLELLAAKVSRGRRKRVVVPRTPALDELLKELRARHRAAGVNTILVNSFGRPWSVCGFGGSFNRVRDEAHIVHHDLDTGKRKKKHLHDVRGTFCTHLITECNLTDREVAEIMGWSPEKVAGIRRTYVDQSAVSRAIAARIRNSTTG